MNLSHQTPRGRRRTSRRQLCTAAVLTLLVAGAANAQAQSTAAAGYPSKPVTLVVPFAAGSATDQLARAIGQSMTQQTGQPVVIDNRAGASGMIAAQAVARAPADGYTLLITTNTTQSANPHLFKKLSYDPVQDFAPLTGLGKGGQVLVVNANSPYRNVDELLTAARQKPGQLSFGSGSSSSQIAGELLKQLAGVDILHVPYKSNPIAITDLLGGQIDMMITDTATGVPQIKGGKLRALGYSAQQRSAQLPDVPTLAEAGVKGYEMGYWFAAYAPAGTPTAVVAQLNTLLTEGTRSSAAQAFYENAGAQPWTSTPQQLAEFQAAETLKWGRVITEAGIRPE